MVEIMAGVWLTSFCLSMITLGLNFHFTRKRLNSKTLKNLNSNLAKVNLYWSNSAGDFLPLTEDSVKLDASKTLRNTLFLGALGLASLLGFILLVVIVFSIHVLARTRKEIATFRSPLALDPKLTAAEVTSLVNEYRQIF